MWGQRLVAVADDGGDTGNFGQLLRGALRVAAGDDDARRGAAAMDAADVGAGFAIGFGGDATGVDDDDVGFDGGLGLTAGSFQLRGDGFAVGAGSAAAEVFDVEAGRHDSSVRQTRWMRRRLMGNQS